ncbi:FG-GAP repeat domain-containing protein [Opitutus terrae]|uniref:FG-GAP repeat protein n=1 Tax=Opitutus terrae (strain DSM 11246 / JCM 15787 / PB90-1) TaxID=452637 RepID=B1ZRU0_OPITP|nr:VCBS repeat-containing protein [Opitutus terrae]ACB73783.1 FG-GAP repeat protein [Opitutus terrae PB90-1]
MANRSKTTVFLVCLSLLALGAGSAWLYLLLNPPAPPPESSLIPATAERSARDVAYLSVPIGLPVEGHPLIPHLALTDLDADGLTDVLVCDAAANRIGWIRQSPRDVFMETFIGDRVIAPVRVSVCDLNQDGRPDVLVASLGSSEPTNDRVGAVVVLENLGEGKFQNRVLMGDVARVTDARAADVNADGRPDVIVGQSGLAQGEVRWLENRGDWKFESHALAAQPGAVSLAPADYDGDGDLDLAVLFAGERDQVRLFRQAPDHAFSDTVIWTATHAAWGGSGLEVCDLNRDGFPDLLLANGNSFSGGLPEPEPGHGLHWLQNRAGAFEAHRLGAAPGCFSPIAVDVDGDGDVDVVSVSAINHALDPASVWLTAWLNDGQQHFRAEPLARDPSRLICLVAGDLEGNGVPMLVTGAFHAYPPFARMTRVTLWRRTAPPLP